jgi:hypothetical protein
LGSNAVNQDFTATASDCCVEVDYVVFDIHWPFSYGDTTPSMCHGLYTWEADTTTVLDRHYTLGVYAYDINNNYGQAKIPILIDNSAFTPEPTLEPTPGIIRITGDVNNDGITNIIDALFVAQYYVKLDPVIFFPENGDVNQSGTIDIIDALLIAQFYVGVISEFPVY